MKTVIGIISYMPDDNKVRNIRWKRLVDLVDKCNKNFELPIIIVAQNWNDWELSYFSKNMTQIYLVKAEKLGITRAREVLRETFLNLDFDGIICFDDDFELNVDRTIAYKYLYLIETNPLKVIEQANYLMNFIYIPKWVYKNESYDLSINPEELVGYEDWIFVEILRYKYKPYYLNVTDNKLIKKTRHELTKDTYTTWKTMNINELEMTKKCWQIINKNRMEIDKEKLPSPYNLSKCIGIISWLPSDKKLRAERKRRCLELFKKIDTYFKLPILLVAQDWTDEDLKDLEQFKNEEIRIEQFSKLGITKARIELRRFYLEDTDFDYVILLDDDSDLVIEEGGVEQYLSEIELHPNMFGVWNRGFPRLMAISRASYSKLSFDFIANLEAERGEVWEDDAFHKVYVELYPNEVYQFSKRKLQEVSPYSEFDEFSTWQPTKEQQAKICSGWRKIVADWVEYEKSKMKEN